MIIQTEENVTHSVILEQHKKHMYEKVSKGIPKAEKVAHFKTDGKGGFTFIHGYAPRLGGYTFFPTYDNPEEAKEAAQLYKKEAMFMLFGYKKGMTCSTTHIA